MKKVIAFLLAVLTVFSAVNVFAYSIDVEEFTPLLADFKIMQGDTDGNLRLDDYVSRAEFVKMAVAASDYRNTVAHSLKISSYKDVSAEHWAAPYIRVAVDNNLVKGYTDATFKPDNMVTYEEAITILLKVLNYTDDDFGNSWPYGQIGLADNLSITDNVNSSMGEPLTRRQVATLIYNTLDTKMKGSNQKLISIFDAERIENVILVASNNEDNSVTKGKVYTTAGTFEVPDSFDYEDIGKRGNVFVKNGDELISFVPDNQESESYNITSISGEDLILDGKMLDLNDNFTVYYKSNKSTYQNIISSAEKGDTFKIFKNDRGSNEYAVLISNTLNVTEDLQNMERHVVYSTLNNNLVTYKDGVLSTLNIPNNTTVYEDLVKSSFSAKKSELEMGDILYIKRKTSNEIDYVTYEKGNVTGPETIMPGTQLSKYQDLKILKNGISISSDELQTYDVVYTIPELNMLLAYSNKITGIYENAYPNQDIPTSITVSGVSYKIESGTAFAKLSSGGDFKFGDTVTLLLGKTNEVADVLPAGNVNSTVYGYLIETGKKEYTSSTLGKYTGFYVKVVLPNGQVNEYIADKDYKDYVNSVRRITFENGVAKTGSVKFGLDGAGEFNWTNKSLGSQKLAANVDILDVSTTDSNLNSTYVTVFPSRLDKVKISSNDVLYSEKNENNEITALILNNVTGDTYSYGVVVKAENASNEASLSGSYTYDIAGKSSSFNSVGTTYSVKGGYAAKFTFSKNGSVQSMQSIVKVEDNIKDVSYTTLATGKTTYPISDSVVVYKKEQNYTYTIIPLSEIIENDEYTLTAFYDKGASAGGRIRVIIAE